MKALPDSAVMGFGGGSSKPSLSRPSTASMMKPSSFLFDLAMCLQSCKYCNILALTDISKFERSFNTDIIDSIKSGLAISRMK